ncbi:uroporphyrinogen-III synthase [Salsuginibacillus halophilus]|uniref:Uroporphyrinogen-III synthase n=1 Tax=Salsuginibacillus halophilus TaxID=517424 RepID=A0A2P8HCP2_9BACI|nr:uroporphyrinogen-III synthase [Salsuginibacillus halophilus]PSL43997.1 uroporphyrinogen-III synthase [Salsuginibacillus halophilus]
MTLPRVLVTRAAHQNASLSALLRQCGYIPAAVPLIRMEGVLDRSSKAQLWKNIQASTWVVFTSVNTVTFFMKAGGSAAKLIHTSVAAVGEKTKNALEAEGIQVDLVPKRYNAETLADALIAETAPGTEIFLPKSRQARPVLFNRLHAAGRSVRELALYDTVVNETSARTLQQELRHPHLFAVTFASPSSVSAFTQLAEEKPEELKLPVVCIGPTTSEKAVQAGFQHVNTAEPYTAEGLLHQLEHIRKGET